MTNENEKYNTLSDSDIMKHVVVNNELGGVRTITINGETWFAAVDICKVFDRLITRGKSSSTNYNIGRGW